MTNLQNQTVVRGQTSWPAKGPYSTPGNSQIALTLTEV